jgi:hypothetical protein
VIALYGAAAGTGLASAGAQLWTQDSGTVADTAEPSDDFGASLAAGDFGNGTQADLAVGVPGEDLGAAANAGAVNVLYGSATGLTDVGNQLWTQDTGTMLEAAQEGDQFGLSLAAANFGAGPQADLAVGVPLEDVAVKSGVIKDAGAVNVIYGKANGLTDTGNQLWTQNSGTVLDVSETGDQFGIALTGGDFGNTGQADLAVGVPLEDVRAISDAGAANVLYGTATGLTDGGNQEWTQNSGGGDPSEGGDRFGSSVG